MEFDRRKQEPYPNIGAIDSDMGGRRESSAVPILPTTILTILVSAASLPIVWTCGMWGYQYCMLD